MTIMKELFYHSLRLVYSFAGLLFTCFLARYIFGIAIEDRALLIFAAILVLAVFFNCICLKIAKISLTSDRENQMPGKRGQKDK